MRPIDADAMLAELKPITFEMEHSSVTIADMSNIMRSWVERQPTLTPQNEPLTIEQLREMDGEPVWIVEHPDWGHWELSADAEDYIADRDQDLYGLKHDDPAGQCGLHVLGWLAYRRPPERQEDTR